MTREEVEQFAEAHKTGVLNIFAKAHDYADSVNEEEWKSINNLFDDYNRFRYCDKVPQYVIDYMEKTK